MNPQALAQIWLFSLRNSRRLGLGGGADVDMLRNRAQQLGLPVQVYDDPEHQPSEAGDLNVIHTPLASPVVAGQLDPDNAQGVLDALDTAIAGAL